MAVLEAITRFHMRGMKLGFMPAFSNSALISPASNTDFNDIVFAVSVSYPTLAPPRMFRFRVVEALKGVMNANRHKKIKTTPSPFSFFRDKKKFRIH